MKDAISGLLKSAKHLMSQTHYFLKLLELGAIILAALGLILTWAEFNASRGVREATLFVMASELLQKARETDKINNNKRPAVQVGQVRVLEEAIASGVSLQGINARYVRLDHGRFARADFRYANFWGSHFLGTNLSNANLERALLSYALLACADNRGNYTCANLSNANLKNAQLTYAKLYDVKLNGADFEGAILNNAELYSVDFRNVKGLEEKQLKNVCGESVKLPSRFNVALRKCK